MIKYRIIFTRFTGRDAMTIINARNEQDARDKFNRTFKGRDYAITAIGKLPVAYSKKSN